MTTVLRFATAATIRARPSTTIRARCHHDPCDSSQFLSPPPTRKKKEKKTNKEKMAPKKSPPDKPKEPRATQDMLTSTFPATSGSKLLGKDFAAISQWRAHHSDGDEDALALHLTLPLGREGVAREASESGTDVAQSRPFWHRRKPTPGVLLQHLPFLYCQRSTSALAGLPSAIRAAPRGTSRKSTEARTDAPRPRPSQTAQPALGKIP